MPTELHFTAAQKANWEAYSGVEWGHHEAYRAIDGSKVTRDEAGWDGWTVFAAGDVEGMHPYLQIDLGDTRRVAEVIISSRRDYEPRSSLEIKVSTEG